MQWSDAIDCLKQAVEHRRSTYGDGHPEYASSLTSLADLLVDLKRYEDAVPCFEEALAIRQRFLGDQHPLTLRVVRDLDLARKGVAESHALQQAKERERAQRLDARRRELQAREEALRQQQKIREEADAVEEESLTLERTKEILETRRRELEEKRRQFK